MAEEAKAAPPEGGGSSGGKPIILYALVILNMLVVAGVGFMVWSGRQKDAEQAKAIEKVANGEVAEGGGHGAAAGEHGAEAGHGEGHGAEAGHGDEADDDFVGKMIPLETFLVNLSGNRGNKVLKLNMELEVEGERIAEEIDKRKPQIRDIIIIVLSSKTYAQISSTEGKNFLRDEIRDTVNAFLTRGKIKRVHFTELIYQ